jgi:hypothetical protein
MILREMIGSALVISSCSFLSVFYMLINNLPFIFMHFILRYLVKPTGTWNTVAHWNKITHRDRKIVIPCPDLLYSTIPLDLSNRATALLVSGPNVIYASLGMQNIQNSI